MLPGDRKFQQRGFRLFRGKQKGPNHIESNECQYQNDKKEHDAAVLEALPARDFDTVEYPVRHQVEQSGHQCVVDDSQNDFPFYLIIYII